MTDQEIICTFMEQKPPVADQEHAETMDLCGSGLCSLLGFWRCVGGYDEPYLWHPRTLTLDALWEVEERLTDEQTALYCTALDRETRSPEGVGIGWRFVHATPEQKIKALAAVLRPVEHRA